MEALLEACSRILDTAIEESRFVGGGDINEARLLTTATGSFFLKFNEAPQAKEMFQTEARGLELLRDTQAISVPRLHGQGVAGKQAFLLLEYVKPGRRSHRFWEQFGLALSELHRHSHSEFGLDHSNFIGSLPQSNSPSGRWSTFYVRERLEPQVRMAFDAGRLDGKDRESFQGLFHKLPGLLPEEVPSLIHGDLWSGNFLVGEGETPWLIDPSVCYGSREMDLAMSRLFGGFDWRFYRAYEEAFPPVPGWEDRIPLHQLYYLLVHLNLFGGGYLHSVREIVRNFVR